MNNYKYSFIILQNVNTKEHGGFKKVGSPVLGIIIPAFVLITSIVVTWLLYKKFSKH